MDFSHLSHIEFLIIHLLMIVLILFLSGIITLGVVWLYTWVPFLHSDDLRRLSDDHKYATDVEKTQIPDIGQKTDYHRALITQTGKFTLAYAVRSAACLLTFAFITLAFVILFSASMIQ